MWPTSVQLFYASSFFYVLSYESTMQFTIMWPSMQIMQARFLCALVRIDDAVHSDENFAQLVHNDENLFAMMLTLRYWFLLLRTKPTTYVRVVETQRASKFGTILSSVSRGRRRPGILLLRRKAGWNLFGPCALCFTSVVMIFLMTVSWSST